jgi:peptide/nickel transport system substrate-binding protein
LGSLLAAACGRADGTAAQSGEGAAKPAIPQRTLIIVAHEVPADFAAKGLAGGVGAATGVAENVPEIIFNATLTIADERARISPYLAESLPQLNTDSWRLFSDGTMETTYRLKPNLVWHDGQPLTAEDFIFAWEVYAAPEYGVDRSIPIRYIANVLAPDPRTVVIRWKQRWAEAGSLQAELPPLPRHLLEQEHRQGTGPGERFLPNSPFWNANYVGAGPYKLDSYTPSVSIEASAFGAHALGRPRIDRVSIRGIADVNTALATMLAGDIHYGADLFRGEQGIILERDWVPRGAGVVLWEALASRRLFFQLRPERASPLEVASDARVRRAIAHSIDKREAFDAVTAGHGLLSDTYTSPNWEHHPQVDREVAKYPYDPRRAQQLLEEVGYTRDATGRWLTSRGETVDLPIWYTGGATQFEQETVIFVDQLKRNGINASPGLFPTAGSREDRVMLPGIISGSGQGDTGFLAFRSSEIARAENRWSGSNRSAYSNPEFDRLAAAFDMAVDPAERLQLTIQIEKLVSSDLPAIFLYYHSRVWAHVAGLKGPKVRQVLGAGHPTRSIHEWEWGA